MIILQSGFKLVNCCMTTDLVLAGFRTFLFLAPSDYTPETRQPDTDPHTTPASLSAPLVSAGHAAWLQWTSAAVRAGSQPAAAHRHTWATGRVERNGALRAEDRGQEIISANLSWGNFACSLCRVQSGGAGFCCHVLLVEVVLDSTVMFCLLGSPVGDK